jgi:hypothetical protein
MLKRLKVRKTGIAPAGKDRHAVVVKDSRGRRWAHRARLTWDNARRLEARVQDEGTFAREHWKEV